MNRFYAFILLLLLFNSCTNQKNETKLIIYTKAPVNCKLYIKLIPFFGAKEVIIDSTIIKNNKDSLILYVPKTIEEHLYKIIVPNTRLQITFINDSKLIRIHADFFANTYSIFGSTATLSLKKFENSQIIFSNKLNRDHQLIDSIKKIDKNSIQLKNLINQLNIKLSIFSNNNRFYADTVKSPAAFMKVYNVIDFDTNYKELKKFILKASKRFSYYQPIQQLTKEGLATVRIYEEELNLGNSIPSIKLPNEKDSLFSTASLKGKYYLIDFWSTWCPQCYIFKNAEVQIFKKYPNIKLQIVSVAMDDDAANWKKTISLYKYPAIQLIDKKMWQGTAVNKLVFDSIPFNFLIDPNGRIINKAIKSNELLKVIRDVVANCKKQEH